MSVKIDSRRPIRNAQDGLYYMTEIADNLVYPVHHERNRFLGFDNATECHSNYCYYIVDVLLAENVRDNNVKAIRNFNPEITPSCDINPELPANFVVSILENNILVNNYEDKNAIAAWLIAKGNVTF